jgi:hypothetical protein
MNKLVFAAACLVAATSIADTVTVGSGKLYTLQSDVTWAQPFGAQGPSFGFVEGEFGDKHPASFFVKVKSGFDSGWHIHSEDYKAVVVAGTFSEQQQGAVENKLPVGTYFVQPGKQVHRNGCLAGADCLVFVHFDRGADSTMTTPDGKPLKK